MDEVDQDSQVGHHQPQRHGDPDVRDEVPVRARPDGDQHQHRVHEGGHEGAERQLGAAITDEVPQHPRPELGGRQRQGDQDDREDHADDRDDRGRERRQDLARGVGGAADHPRGTANVPRYAARSSSSVHRTAGRPRAPPALGPATGWSAASRGASVNRAPKTDVARKMSPASAGDSCRPGFPAHPVVHSSTRAAYTSHAPGQASGEPPRA